MTLEAQKPEIQKELNTTLAPAFAWFGDSATEPPAIKTEPESTDKKPEFLNDDGATVHAGMRVVIHDQELDGSRNWYCGRDLGIDVVPSDHGVCGPDAGPQCPSCQRLQAIGDGSSTLKPIQALP